VRENEEGRKTAGRAEASGVLEVALNKWESTQPTPPANTTTSTSVAAKFRADEPEELAGAGGIAETGGLTGGGRRAETAGLDGCGEPNTGKALAELLKSIAASKSSSTLGQFENCLAAVELGDFAELARPLALAVLGELARLAELAAFGVLARFVALARFAEPAGLAELARFAEPVDFEALARLAELAAFAGPAPFPELARFADLDAPAGFAELARFAAPADLAELAGLAELARFVELGDLAELARLAGLADLAAPADFAEPADRAEPADFGELAPFTELARFAEPVDFAEPADLLVPADFAAFTGFEDVRGFEVLAEFDFCGMRLRVPPPARAGGGNHASASEVGCLRGRGDLGCHFLGTFDRGTVLACIPGDVSAYVARDILEITAADGPSYRARPALAAVITPAPLTEPLSPPAIADLSVEPVPASCREQVALVPVAPDAFGASARAGSRAGVGSVGGALMVPQVGGGMLVPMARGAPLGNRDATARSSAGEHRSSRHHQPTMNTHSFSFGVLALPVPAELAHFYHPTRVGVNPSAWNAARSIHHSASNLGRVPPRV
jgi:hypothetical protein